MAKVLWCSCKHDFQDKKYGAKMRVHNSCKGDSPGSLAYRCTVCKLKKK